MSLKVVIPAPLRKHTSGAEVVEVEAGTVQEVIDRLESRYPGIRKSVCDESGGLRRFINIYVDGEDVRFLDNLNTPTKDGAEVAIVPAISGGLCCDLRSGKPQGFSESCCENPQYSRKMR